MKIVDNMELTKELVVLWGGILLLVMLEIYKII